MLLKYLFSCLQLCSFQQVALGSFYEEDHDDPGSAAGAPMEEQPSPTKQTGAAGQSAQPKPKSRCDDNLLKVYF